MRVMNARMRAVSTGCGVGVPMAVCRLQPDARDKRAGAGHAAAPAEPP